MLTISNKYILLIFFLKLFIFFLLLIATIGNLSAQKVSVKFLIPPAAGLNVQLIGYNGFKTDTLVSVHLNQSGTGKATVQYKGFVLIKLSDGKQYPFILKKKITKFVLSDYDSLPAFPGDNDNRFLYKYLLEKKQLSGKTMLLIEALSFFKENDPYLPILLEEKSEIETYDKMLEKIFTDSSKYMSSILLKAKSLMESTYGIKTQAELNERKKAFTIFILNHFNDLLHSDMIQQLAVQYVMMDEYVLIGQENHYNQVVKDVEDWINMIGKMLPPQDIVNFFINYYLGRSMVGITGMLAEQYLEYSQCSLPSLPKKHATGKGKITNDTIPNFNIRLSSNNDFLISLDEMNNSSKLLFFFQSECPACFAQQVMMNRYLLEQYIQLPAITVFSNGDPDMSLSILNRLQKEQFYYTESGSLYQLAAIDKFPAFVVLAKNNTILQKFYSIEELKKYLSSLKNAE